jgi:hypothetical protein
MDFVYIRPLSQDGNHFIDACPARVFALAWRVLYFGRSLLRTIRI